MATSSRKSNIVIARTDVVMKAPYMASLLYHLVPVESTKLPTMAVTLNHVLLYNPAFVDKLKPLELAGVLVHECLHVMSGHILRMQVFPDHDRANRAADLAIYDAIIAMGFILPKDAIKPGDYMFPSYLTLEQYYALLEQYDKEHPQEDEHGHQVCSGMCGSGVGHGDESEEADGLEEEGRLPVEREMAIQATAEKAREHFSQNPGSAPQYFNELFKALAEPAVIPWRRVLRVNLRDSVGEARRGSTDYTMKRLNKRSFLRDRPIPSMVDFPPTVAVIVDTSGSMSDKLLKDCFRECTGILKGLGVDWIWLVQADVLVATKPIKAKLRDLRGEIQVHGRGGTSFTDALEKTAVLSPRPDIIVYMTDGYGSTSFRPPGAVIWCLVGGNKEPPAPWGSVVIVDR